MMCELFGKTIDEYTKEELWEILADILLAQAVVKSNKELDEEVERFISSCQK